MTYPRLMGLMTAIAAGIVTLVGCGSDRSALSTAPSVVSTAAAIEQSVITAQNTAYVITSLVAGTSCPNLQFQISTYLIKTSAATAYEGGSCASLRTGTKLTAVNGERPDMNVMLVYATRIAIQPAATAPPPAPKPDPAPAPAANPQPPAPPMTPTPVPGPFETTVTVSSVVSTSSCPYREFMVGPYRLTTSALTRYDGGRCADIAAGATFGIVATKGAKDLSVLVSTIAFKPEKDAEPPTGSSEGLWAQVTIDRPVDGGNCPAMSFLVGPYTVTVSAATVYDGGMCTDLKAGAALRLEGTKLGDDHVLATRISLPE